MNEKVSNHTEQFAETAFHAAIEIIETEIENNTIGSIEWEFAKTLIDITIKYYERTVRRAL